MCNDTVLGPGRWSSCYLPTVFLESVAVPLMTVRVLNVLLSPLPHKFKEKLLRGF